MSVLGHTISLARCKFAHVGPQEPVYMLRSKASGYLRILRPKCNSGLPMECMEAYVCPSHASAVAGNSYSIEKTTWKRMYDEHMESKRPILVVLGGECDLEDGETKWQVFTLGIL